MNYKKILSLQHPFVKYCVKLRKESKFRQGEQKAQVAGSILVQELIAQGVALDTLITTEKNPLMIFGAETILVSEEVMYKIAGAEEDSVAIFKIPEKKDLSHISYLLVLDQVGDPGNLGTLLRTAYALKWEGVFIVEGSCDPFGEKALRASKGASFLLPLQTGSWEDFCKVASRFTVLTADMEGVDLKNVQIKKPLALILSKESTGAREEAKQRFQRISIPMHSQAESLNVAAAGAIFLYTLRGML